MTTASGSNHGLFYVKETTRGVTPATPTFKPARNTGVTLALSKDPIESEEIRPDRQIACFRHGNRRVGGGFNYEFGYADFDDFLAAVMCSDWASDVLLAGTARTYFTFERIFSDIATRIRYTGCEINELSLSIQPNAMVTGSITVVGKDQDPLNSAIAGATYETTLGGCPFDSFSGTIKEGNVTTGIITQIELTIANGIEPSFAIGNKGSVSTSIGKSNVNGTMTAYFESVALMNKFVNEEASDIEFTLVNEAGDELKFFLPNVKYNGGQPDVSGTGDVTIALPFQALYSAGVGSQLAITRTPNTP